MLQQETPDTHLAGPSHHPAEFMRLVLDSTVEAFYSVNREGVTTLCNASFVRMLGFARQEDAVGRKLHDVIHHSHPDGSHYPRSECPIYRCASTGTAEHVEGEYFFRLDGSRFPVEYWTHPIVRNGELQGAICTFFDVTEKRRAQDEVQDAQRRKDEFLATLAHELRNPLAPLRNGLEIMGKTRPDDAQSERLRAMMVRQLGQLTRLVDDILDVSRMTHGKITLRKQPMDLRDAASAAVDSVGPAIAAKGQQLSVDTPHSPIQVDGDAARLTQVLMNMLDNASKYTPPEGHIELALSHGDETGAAIFVRDTGNGIAADMLEKIFEPFVQVPSAGRTNAGLGIGLMLVKRLVELHGGSVRAASAGLGQGAEFTVRLPARQAVASS